MNQNYHASYFIWQVQEIVVGFKFYKVVQMYIKALFLRKKMENFLKSNSWLRIPCSIHRTKYHATIKLMQNDSFTVYYLGKSSYGAQYTVECYFCVKITSAYLITKSLKQHTREHEQWCVCEGNSFAHQNSLKYTFIIFIIKKYNLI